jgi:hypothetical protein
MELLLNLAWLLLALPAYWLWCSRSVAAVARKPSAWQCLFALGCVIVVLFPVISATDDLCAMRAEFEESPCSKHSIRQHSNERLSASKWHIQPALIFSSNFSFTGDPGWHSTPAPHGSTLEARVDLRPGRSPPSSLLA